MYQLNSSTLISLAIATFCLSTAGRISKGLMPGGNGGAIVAIVGAIGGAKAVAKCSPKQQRNITITRVSVNESIFEFYLKSHFVYIYSKHKTL
jgi:hypothetical protein